MKTTQLFVRWFGLAASALLLEQSSSLTPPVTWVTNTASVSDNGSTKSVTFPATDSVKFFRLCRP